MLSAESLVGEFDLLNLAVLTSGLDWQLDYLFDFMGSTDFVRLSVVSAETGGPGTVSPVPLPAAAWLFGSAMLGLFGFSRRRRARL